MFWIMTQESDRHPQEKKWVEYWPGCGNWDRDMKDVFSFNPKRGIGPIMWIEADTAQDAWRYMSSLPAPGFPRRWRRPRGPYEAPGPVYHYIQPYFPASSPRFNPPAFLHFSDGMFFRIDGLDQSIIQAIVDEGLEHEWD